MLPSKGEPQRHAPPVAALHYSKLKLILEHEDGRAGAVVAASVFGRRVYLFPDQGITRWCHENKEGLLVRVQEVLPEVQTIRVVAGVTH